MRGTHERGLGPELPGRARRPSRSIPRRQPRDPRSASMIRIAMLGAGRIGKIHAGNVASNPGCRLIAVADPVKQAAGALAETLGAEASTDPKATLARGDIDAVVIGTPTDTHVDLMLESVRHGKAVLCEKPIDL